MISSSSSGSPTLKKELGRLDRNAYAPRNPRNPRSGGKAARCVGRCACRRRPAAARAFAAGRRHRCARLVGSCRGLPEVCDRANNRRAGRLARTVHRLDLRREAEARGRRLPDDLAIGQEPGHRRDGASRAGGRARSPSPSTTPPARRWRWRPTTRSTFWPASKKASQRPRVSSIRRWPDCLFWHTGPTTASS